MSTAPVSFLSVLADQITSLTNQGNTISAKVAASSERSTNKLVHELIKTSDDATVTKWREFEEKALAKLESERAKVAEYVRANLMSDAGETLSQEQIDALHAEFKTLRENVNAAHKFAAMQPGFTPEWAEALPKLSTFKGNASKGASGQSGIRRPRIASITLNGQPFTVEAKNSKGQIVPKATLTGLAAALQKTERDNGNADAKISAGQLLAAIEATDANWQNSTGVDFVYAGKSTNYQITVVPADKE